MKVGESRGKCSLEVKSRHFIGCLAPPSQHLSLIAPKGQCPAIAKLNNNQKWAWTDNLTLLLQRITFVLIIWDHLCKDGSPWTLSIITGKCEIPSRRECRAVHRIHNQGWRWSRMANLVQPSMRKGAKMSLSNNLSSHILKISTDRDHTTSLGRLFPGMAVLTLKKFLSYIKMIPLLVQLVALAFSMWILGKKEPSSSFSPRF